ncbi:ester cyclase [Mycolicibacterium novocastrense]|uniref:ester cyclase n=1 Tax=Mycolicibacterium novocastrense TaxID=59813 RepID=UPI00074672BE|nr:ester cyclase [Mycolicibacterium novocastrense]KUH69617.1 ester cyclase [Mycolicibacterium novocastrense]KUH76549.1 ester cyclase [Mycolicibacterium novocastrense]KUH78900.1 ester cyclase [Mycolicibacterium novocastrense]
MTFSEDEIRDLVECLYTSIDRRDWATVQTLVSPRLVVEVAGPPVLGWQEWQAHLEEFTRGFSDGRHAIEEILVDGSHGITRFTFTGTHDGEFRGIPATGAKVAVAGIHIDRFQGDTLVAHRGQLDLHGLLQQLGSL